MRIGPTLSDEDERLHAYERIKMAFKPNYSFERREREKAKSAKKAARMQAKRDKAEKAKEDKATTETDRPAESSPAKED